MAKPRQATTSGRDIKPANVRIGKSCPAEYNSTAPTGTPTSSSLPLATRPFSRCKVQQPQQQEHHPEGQAAVQKNKKRISNKIAI